MAEEKYWKNVQTGEYVQHWKDPSYVRGDFNFGRYVPAEQSYLDKMAQQGREQGAIAELQKAIKLFDKNYGKGMEAKARASAVQQAILSGLGGTTRPGAVSAGLKAEFEDMRRGRLAEAQTNLANFFGNYRDPYGVTPQVELGQKQLAQQGRQAGQQLDLSYAQLGQQGRQFEANLGLGYANLNARNTQPASVPNTQPASVPSSGDSIWGNTPFHNKLQFDGGSYEPLDTSNWASVSPTDYVGTGNLNLNFPSGSIQNSVFGQPTTGADLASSIKNIDKTALGY